ncbi:hypothetical protein DSM3645_18341 [Blastopirellula marina DSM 3645]|uniref:Uncharacterized protein n=1 Tax=Blastopirellula marina DSM 3645 TaxID=314230 RepID=A3ZYW2_9BACT|nr:hypothetical protein DSM3645_18341 [Blastopirellula marina DSM 3645]
MKSKFYARGTFSRSCNHRRADRVAVACRAASSGSGVGGVGVLPTTTAGNSLEFPRGVIGA